MKNNLNFQKQQEQFSTLTAEKKNDLKNNNNNKETYINEHKFILRINKFKGF